MKRYIHWLNWLLLGLIPLALASEEQRPLRIPSGVMVGELSTSINNGTFPMWGDRQAYFETRATHATLDMRYALWSLMGEPVYRFEAKGPIFDELSINDGNQTLVEIKTLASLKPGEVQWLGGDSRVIYVAENLMELVSLYDFAFHAMLSPVATGVLPEAYHSSAEGSRSTFTFGATTIGIYRRNPGVMGRPGQWGWDVPGSPNWDSTFTYRSQISQIRAGDSYQELLYEADFSKEIMRRLLYNYHINNEKPFHLLEVGDYRVHYGDLLYHIHQAHPRALDPIYGIQTPRQRQILEIYRAYETRRRQGEGGEGGEGEERAKALVDRLFTELADEVPAALHDRWRHTQAPAHDPIAEQILRQLNAQMEPLLVEDRALSGEAASRDDLQRLAQTAEQHFAAHPDSTLTPAWQRVQATMRLLGAQGLRRVWVVAAAGYQLQEPWSGPTLTLTAVRRPPPGETAEERRRREAREEREREARKERQRREREERARRNAENQAHDRRIVPPPVHSPPFALLVPEEMDDPAISSGLQNWMHSNLQSHQQLNGSFRYYTNSSLNYTAHVFASESAAKEWMAKQSSRQVASEAPPPRLMPAPQ